MKTSNRFCRANCCYLEPKEEGQSNRKEPHICRKFSTRVYHLGSHPKLNKCSECLTSEAH